MGTFGNLRSTDGIYRGVFPAVTTMNAGGWEQAPELFTNSFGRFEFKELGEPGTIDLRWDNVYKNCVVSFPATFTITDLALELQIRGATTQSSARELFSIPTTLQNTWMCLMGWADRTDIVRYAAYKRVLNPDNTVTYTSISSTYALPDNSGNDSIYAVAGKFHVNSSDFYGFGLASKQFFTQANREQIAVPMFVGTETCFSNIFGGDPEEEPYSPEFGPGAQPGGGYVPGGGGTPTNPYDTKTPTFDNTSDKIELPTKPTLDALGSKFFHAYKVTEASMYYIADALFPQPVWTQNDIIMMMGEIGQMLFFNKQIDYMLDCLILPIDVPAGDWEAVKVGGHTLKTVIEGTTYTINGMPVDDCYVDFTCGSLSIDEYWVNFLDFAGTKVKLFLPYVGYVDIQPEYIIGGTLYVDYRFNVIDGSFMCYVRSDSGYSELEESMIGQYAGVAAVHIPLQSQDYSNKVSGLISAIGSVAAGAASGGVGAATAVGAAANAGNTLVQKPGSSHANGYNASSSFLSGKTPYLIIERQWAQFSEKYPEEVGVPSNVMCRIGDLTGLVKSENAHLDVIPCNKEVKDMIAQLLADGIIVG